MTAKASAVGGWSSESKWNLFLVYVLVLRWKVKKICDSHNPQDSSTTYTKLHDDLWTFLGKFSGVTKQTDFPHVLYLLRLSRKCTENVWEREEIFHVQSHDREKMCGWDAERAVREIERKLLCFSFIMLRSHLFCLSPPTMIHFSRLVCCSFQSEFNTRGDKSTTLLPCYRVRAFVVIEERQ